MRTVLLLAFAFTVAVLSGQTPVPAPAPEGPAATTPGQPVRPQRRERRPPRDTAAELKGTGRVRGRVAMAGGGPARRAEVRLSGGALRDGRTTRSDSEGRYEFGDLPAGRYVLSVRKSGFVMVASGDRPALRSREIEVGEGETVVTENLTMMRGGVIAGRVVDEFGDPAPDVMVMAHQYQWMGGRRRLAPLFTPARTDDIGQFRLFGLAQGEYIVSAAIRDRGMMTASEDRTGYAPVYFPGTPNAGDAQPITVRPGQELGIGDIQLVALRTSRISGIVMNSQGRPAPGVQLMLRDDPGHSSAAMMVPQRMARSAADGTFALTNVPPGHYVLDAREGDWGERDDDTLESANMPVSVVDADITGLTVVMNQGATITGRITFEGGPAPTFRDRLVRVFAASIEGDQPFFFGGGRRSTISPDWTFEIGGLSGQRILRVNLDGPESQTWMLKSVLLGGDDVTDTGFELKGTERLEGLEIVMTNRIPEISGTVTDSQGHPLKEYAVLLFPSNPKLWNDTGRFRRQTLRPDQEGRFRVRAIPAGEYFLVAKESFSSDEAGSPEFLEDASRHATRVRVGDGESKVVALKLAP